MPASAAEFVLIVLLKVVVAVPVSCRMFSATMELTKLALFALTMRSCPSRPSVAPPIAALAVMSPPVALVPTVSVRSFVSVD